MISVDDLTISLIVLIGVRSLAFLVFLELLLRYKKIKYAVLSVAWMTYALGPIFGLWGYLTTGNADHPLFGYFAAIGTLLLMVGVLTYYQAVSPRKLFLRISVVAVSFGIVIWFYPISSGVFAVLAQLIFLVATLIIVVFKRKWFFNLGGNSYYWLLPILLIGLFHAFGFTFVYSEAPFSIRLLATFLLNTTLIIFFLHFEYNQSLLKLIKSEERYRALFNHNPVRTVVVDNDARIVMHNFIKEDGKLPRIGDVMYRDYAKKHQVNMFEELMKCIQSGEGNEFNELKYKERFLNIRIAPFPAGAIITSINITKRKQAENSLRESEVRYKRIFQFSPDPIIIHDMDMTIIDANSKATKVFGYSKEELLKKTMFELYPDSELKHATQVLDTMRKEDRVNIETTFLRKDGSAFIAEASPCKYTLESKTISHVVIRDITNRNKVESERKRLTSAIEQIREVVAITGYDGVIKYVNPAFTNITGYSKLEVIGQNSELLKSPQHDRSFYKNLWDTILSGNRWTGRLVNKCKDGSLYTAECSISPVKNKDNVIQSFVWILNDITEKLELEARIRHGQQLESIGNLAGGIAHDFNNILFPIIGMSEMIMEDLEPDSSVYENAKVIYRAGNRAKELVSQILAFSHQSKHEMMPVKFQKILKEVLKLCRSTIPMNIKIKQKVQQDCGSIWANSTQLHQIGMNLITNAYHAVQDKNGTITVELRETLLEKDSLSTLSVSPGKYALFSVSDNGIGMPDKIKSKIFEPYFTTKEKGKGTGLGLAVVYGIVKDFGGDIHVYSEDQVGTTFNIYIPLMKKNADMESRHFKAEMQAGYERLLLVDDEPSITKLMKLTLERLGYKVTSCVSSIEALETFKANPDKFDMVISDMSMPNMTGDQLSYEIRQIRPQIPIIICTGFSEQINKEKAEEIGVNGFLMKPIVKSEMAEKIRNVFDGVKKI